MKVIIYRKTGVVSPGDSDYAIDVPTDEKFIDDIVDRVTAEGATEIRVIDDSNLPQDRLFRNAWDDSNPENYVSINIVKAKVIAHGIRRIKRDEVFAPNLEILRKQSMGIPLAANENATTAADANADYKTAVDDIVQADIETAGTDAELRTALNGLG